MTDPQLMFFTIFGAVLMALLLAACFVWGMVKYTRLEAHGREHDSDGTTALIAILMPLAFLGLSFFIVLL